MNSSWGVVTYFKILGFRDSAASLESKISSICFYCSCFVGAVRALENFEPMIAVRFLYFNIIGKWDIIFTLHDVFHIA